MAISEKNRRWYEKMIANACCIGCGGPAELRPDGSHYQYCREHRLAQNNRMKLRNAAKRAALRAAVVVPPVPA